MKNQQDELNKIMEEKRALEKNKVAKLENEIE